MHSPKKTKEIPLILFFFLMLPQTLWSQEVAVHPIYPEYGNVDTLKYKILSTGDVDAYNKLRISISTWDLVPYSEVMVHQYNYYPAFIDLYVANITLFEHYRIVIPEKMRQKSNDYLKKAYMTGDFCAKTLLYVRYKNGIYLDKDTAIASLIKNSDVPMCLSPTDTLIFYRRIPNIGDAYTSFSIVSGKVQEAKIIIYNQWERLAFNYNSHELDSIGACDNTNSQINVANGDCLFSNNGRKSISKNASELIFFLKKIFVEHGGRINRSGWWMFLEKY